MKSKFQKLAEDIGRVNMLAQLVIPNRRQISYDISLMNKTVFSAYRISDIALEKQIIANYGLVHLAESMDKIVQFQIKELS